MTKPIVLHCGDDVKWDHELYQKLRDKFEIRRSHSMPRDAFIEALENKKFGDFYAIYRPSYQTGGEMNPWDAELMFVLQS